MRRWAALLVVLSVLLGNCDQMITQQKAKLYSSDAQMLRPDPEAVRCRTPGLFNALN